MTTRREGGADRLELLRTFVRIVETGSLSAAAEQLETTQPTVSRRLQRLERSLGMPLLTRTTHSMTLTDEGARCLEHAQSILERWEAIESELRGRRERPRGTLRVVAPSIFGQDHLIAPVVRLLREHPELKVEWMLNDRLPDFAAERVDCAVRVGTVDSPDVVALRVAEIPRIVVAARAAFKGRVPAAPESLARVPWLALRTFYEREVTLERPGVGEVFHLAIEPRFITDNLLAMRQAALAGLGACVVSSWVVTEDLEAGRLVQLVPSWRAPSLPISVVFPRARSRPARLRAFLEVMKRYLATIPGVDAPTPVRPPASRPAS
ncbi:MAG: LysR family transcriptional regulator [Nannocystaceae bacterium]